MIHFLIGSLYYFIVLAAIEAIAIPIIDASDTIPTIKLIGSWTEDDELFYKEIRVTFYQVWKLLALKLTFFEKQETMVG